MRYKILAMMLVLTAMALISTKPAMAQTATICDVHPIPPGWVAIRKDTQLWCPDYPQRIANANIVKVPGPSEWICNWSPKPAGYVIVSQRTERLCTSNLDWSGISLNVKIPGYEEVICDYSPIPSGYVIVGSRPTNVCRPLGEWSVARVIRRVF
jgi:hypothetical protein